MRTLLVSYSLNIPFGETFSSGQKGHSSVFVPHTAEHTGCLVVRTPTSNGGGMPCIAKWQKMGPAFRLWVGTPPKGVLELCRQKITIFLLPNLIMLTAFFADL